jgi:hypothetical protein
MKSNNLRISNIQEKQSRKNWFPKKGSTISIKNKFLLDFQSELWQKP